MKLPAWISGRENLGKFLGNSGLMLAERLLRQVVGLFVGVLVARHLGVEQFGVWVWLLAITSLFMPIGQWGLETVGLRYLVHEPDRRGAAVGTILAVRACLGAVAMAAAIICAAVLAPGEGRVLLAAMLALTCVFAAGEACEYWFQAICDQRLSTLARIAAFGAATIVRLLLVASDAPLAAFVAVACAEGLLTGLGLYAAFRRKGGPRLAYDGRLAKDLLVSAVPVAAATLMITVSMRVDQLLIERWMGSSELGLYGVAVRLAECWYVVPGTLCAAALPLAMEARKRSEEEFREKIQRLYDLLTFASLLFGIGAVIAGPIAIPLLFGEPYRHAAVPFAIAAWSGVFVSWGVVRGAVTSAIGSFRFMLLATGLLMSANLTLNLLLVPWLGMVGAAIAGLAANALASIAATALYPPLRFTLAMQLRSLMVWRFPASLRRWIRGGAA